ncbi:MAG: endoglucanase [Actinomycetota bacterium]|nr:endoglucanase [Actinomycetota bacterium]
MLPHRHLAQLALAVIAAFTVGLLAAQPAAAPHSMLAGFTRLSENPFAGAKLYADPRSDASVAASTAADPADSAALRKVAAGATADWFGDWNSTSTVTAAVAKRSRTITAAGAMPVFVTYDIPQRDCHSYSAGGASSPAAYRAWIDAFAAGVGTARTAVVVEPDALAQLGCLSSTDQQVRLSLVRYAVETLGRKPNVAVYVDAGHAGWIRPATMVSRLKAAGVAAARGIALNVSNYDTTSNELAYARAIAPAIGWKRVVIDTSRNGLGPAPDGSWCNPGGRALGALPGSVTGDKLIDAFLWVKRPGESDGTCNSGPPAGQFWTSYAVGLGKRATW